MAKKSSMNSFMREFVSEENRSYRLRIGSTIASSLAGVVCGVIMASIVWFTAVYCVLAIVKYLS